jgi:hypothetical protein
MIIEDSDGTYWIERPDGSERIGPFNTLKDADVWERALEGDQEAIVFCKLAWEINDPHAFKNFR